MVKSVQFGLTIEQFWDMSWRDFTIYASAHERNELNEWERVRKIVYAVYCSIPTDSKTKLTESQLFPLPTDEKPVPVAKEEIEKTIKLLQSNGNRSTTN